MEFLIWTTWGLGKDHMIELKQSNQRSSIEELKRKILEKINKKDSTIQ